MKNKKQTLFQRYLFKFRAWKAQRQRKILDTMMKYSLDEAIRLTNQKRDILNNKVWCVGNPGQYLVFARYQKKALQTQHLLGGNLTSKNLDEIASYVAFPVTEKDKRRRGLLRIFNKKSSSQKT
jgi:replicative superfamily II helicase